MAVTEAGSSKRIPKFRLIPGRLMREGKIQWAPPYPGTDGVIPIDPQKLPDAGGVRVEAEGKIPQTLCWENKEQRPEIIPFEMQPDPGLKCRILLPDGKPASGATIAVAIPGYSAKVEGGRFSNFIKEPEDADAKGFETRSPRFCQADSSGDFLLPAEIEPSALVIAVHDAGMLEMPYLDFVSQRNVKVTAWATIEGKVVWQDIPGPDMPITLQVSRGAFAGEMLSQRLTVTSGMDGSFSFSKVPPGRIYLQWLMTEVPDRVSRRFEFEARPGSNAFLVGGKGRTVTGQLSGLPSWKGFSLAIEPWDASQPAPGQGIPGDAWRIEGAAWAFIRQTSLGACYFKDNIRVESDGQFEIPDVLPEFYHIILTPPAGTRPVIGNPTNFRVEAETMGNPPPRLNLGLVPVPPKVPEDH